MTRPAPHAQLWEKIGHLFAEDDGSLPEVQLYDLSPQGCDRVYRALLQRAAPLDDTATVWSKHADADTPLRELADPVHQVIAGKIEPFHFLLTSITMDATPIPDLGVFVFGDGIALDYRMGQSWNPIVLGAFVQLVATLRGLDPGCRLTWWEEVSLPEVRTQFIAAVEAFLDGAATDGGRNTAGFE
jgi:hypothetical protein